jgi:hypothetical protein
VRIGITLLFIFLVGICFSQVKDDDYVLEDPRDYEKDPARSANYIELFGNAGFFYSLNFDRIFLYKKNFKVAGRAGASVLPNSFYWEQAYVLENSYILLPNPHHLEIGPSITLQRKFNMSCTDSTQFKWESWWYGIFRIGYRFQKQEDGFFFKAGFTPILYRKNDCEEGSPLLDKGNWFWLGLAIGVSY